MPFVTSAGGSTGGREVVIISGKGGWQTAHLDLEATANTAAELRRPGSVTSNNVAIVELGAATRVLYRVKYDASATVTTSPVIRIIGAWGSISQSAGVLPDDGTVRYAAIATAQTITLNASTDQRDATNAYSAFHSAAGTDMLGANYAIALVETAANTSTGAVTLEVLAIN